MRNYLQSDADGQWANGGQIIDLNEALDFLNTPTGPHTLPPHLARRATADGEAWVLVRPWHKQDVDGFDFLLINQTLARKIVQERLAEQDTVRSSDGSFPEREIYVLSDAARVACCEIYRGLADAADHFMRTFAGSNEEAQIG